MSPTRIGALGDRSRHAKFAAALRKVINKDSVCLCVGSDIMLPLMASMLGAKEVYVVVDDSYAHSLLKEYADHNGLRNIFGISKDALCLSEQDLMKKEAQSASDDTVEPQSLWEYPCEAMTQEFTIIKLDMTKDPDTTDTILCHGEVPFEK
ncbi:hypothetical protein HPB49_011086 [Dermacentor silvarum]|uniref:Uncharacterized protein n=1 Tax=Dermacentor silvarum TaxID=543639 RepID=A0ACB8DZL9_DERSI|nr:hypothetical protein HPB49_011086 [Dermacentor silvarum]